jgi:hypothetical protein
MRQGREWGGTGTAVAATRVGGGGGIGRRCVGGDGKLWHGGGTSRAEILRTGSGWGWSGPTQGQEEEEEMKVSVRCGTGRWRGNRGGELIFEDFEFSRTARRPRAHIHLCFLGNIFFLTLSFLCLRKGKSL